MLAFTLLGPVPSAPIIYDNEDDTLGHAERLPSREHYEVQTELKDGSQLRENWRSSSSTDSDDVPPPYIRKDDASLEGVPRETDKTHSRSKPSGNQANAEELSNFKKSAVLQPSASPWLAISFTNPSSNDSFQQ